jgi:hypothetical protein
MSARAVRQAFRDHLTTAITGGSVTAPYVDTINREVRNEDRPDEWVTLAFFPAEEEPVSIGPEGGRLYRETGTVFAHVLTLAGTGDDRAAEIADEIRDLYRAAKLAPGLTVETVSPGDTGDGDEDGNFFRASVEITYRFEIIA